jgi:hypothetical protein
MFTLPHLPPSVAHEVFADLCATLPPPAHDTAEARENRDILAMAAVADLHPADAFEALLAAEAVTANAFAKDSLRLATEHRDDFTKTVRCRAQACAMMRQERQALRTLEDMQKARWAAAPAASALGADQRPQPTVPHPDQTEAARDPAPPTPAPADPAPQRDALAQAEEFAMEEPVAAAQIRFDRGLTPANTARIDPAMIPSDPAVIEALLNGTSPVLCTLDDIGGEKSKAAWWDCFTPWETVA